MVSMRPPATEYTWRAGWRAGGRDTCKRGAHLSGPWPAADSGHSDQLFRRKPITRTSRAITQVVKGVDRLLGLAGQPASAVRDGLRELVLEYRPGVEG